MSSQMITKQVSATVCDGCQKEIDTEDAKNWAQLTRQFVSKPTKEARRLTFQWLSPKSSTTKEIRYDFQAECLYKIIEAVLPAPQSTGEQR